MKRLKDAVLKIYPNFMEYSMMDDLDEWEYMNDYFISHLEHELDLYYNWKEEGYTEPCSLVKKQDLQKVKRVIDNYYKGMYIKE